MPVEKIDITLCKGCETCVETCSNDVIRMDEKTKKAVIKYPQSCNTCYWDLCQQDSPQHAISVSPAEQPVILTMWGIGDWNYLTLTLKLYRPKSENPGLLDPRGFDDIASASDCQESCAAAVWAFQHQKTVGHGTATLPNAKARYLPMVTARGTVGVLAISVKDTAGEFTIEQEQVLSAYADLAAIAIESPNVNISGPLWIELFHR